MQNNSTNDPAEMLIKYMDGELSASEKEAAEKSLQEDTSLQERYQYFLAAKQAIKSEGLKKRVQAIQREYAKEMQPDDRSTAKIIKPQSFFKTFMSAAAILIVVIAGYGVFQYSSVNNQSVYNDNFISYQLPVNRSSEKTDNLDALYNVGNYNGILNAFNKIEHKDQKAYFLAAQSYLQLNNANAAIDAFLQVENINNGSAERYFVQETDYYLMLAYIKAGKIDSAEKRLNKITSDKQHLFYNKVKEISRTKLMMLKWKEKQE